MNKHKWCKIAPESSWDEDPVIWEWCSLCGSMRLGTEVFYAATAVAPAAALWHDAVLEAAAAAEKWRAVEEAIGDHEALGADLENLEADFRGAEQTIRDAVDRMRAAREHTTTLDPNSNINTTMVGTTDMGCIPFMLTPADDSDIVLGDGNEKNLRLNSNTTCKHEIAEPHSCPFLEEIRGDNTTLCTCCSSCQHICAMDI